MMGRVVVRGARGASGASGVVERGVRCGCEFKRCPVIWNTLHLITIMYSFHCYVYCTYMTAKIEG